MSGRVGTMSLATSCDITRHHAIGSGSGLGVGGVRCHSTEGVAERAEVAGAGAEAEDGRESEAEGVPLTGLSFRAPATQRREGTTINSRPYETAVAVTPPGQFAPEPTITLPPPRPAPQAPSDDEDPYQLDMSDESSEDDCPTKKKKQPNPIDPQDDGYIPDFWGVCYPNRSTTAERDNSLCFMYSNQAYCSKRSNTLFIRLSATNTSTFELNNYDTSLEEAV